MPPSHAFRTWVRRLIAVVIVLATLAELGIVFGAGLVLSGLPATPPTVAP